jgi:hypothetical protein
MTYVIGEPCADVLDRACVEECPVEAICYEDDLPDKWQVYAAENARFFADSLPGRGEPLGSPGGAAKLGVVAGLMWPQDDITDRLASPDIPSLLDRDPDLARIVRRSGGTIAPDGGPLTAAGWRRIRRRQEWLALPGQVTPAVAGPTRSCDPASTGSATWRTSPPPPRAGARARGSGNGAGPRPPGPGGLTRQPALARDAAGWAARHGHPMAGPGPVDGLRLWPGPCTFAPSAATVLATRPAGAALHN